MAEEKPSLHIDLDWKKQAQEEKKRLEEEAKKRAEAASAKPPMPAAAVASAATAPAASGRATRGRREIAPASIATLTQSLVAQATVYLSNMEGRGDEAQSMDMAKHLIDTLHVLETKTQGNLTADEQKFLDLAQYELRMRYISVATQIIAGQ